MNKGKIVITRVQIEMHALETLDLNPVFADFVPVGVVVTMQEYVYTGFSEQFVDGDIYFYDWTINDNKVTFIKI